MKNKARFIFDSRWAKTEEAEDLVKEIWNQLVNGSRMFKVQQKKLKKCKVRFIKWRKSHKRNTKADIELIQALQNLGGERDWERWKQLKHHSTETYKEEEEFWSRKAGITWLKEKDRNTKYFHATTAERRKRNRIEVIMDEQGKEMRD